MISRWAYGTLWSLPLSELCTSVHTVPGEPPTQPARRRGEQEQLKRQADEIWSLISAKNFTNSIKTSIGKTHSVTPSEILPPLSRSGTDETGSDVILSDPPRLPATWTIKASTSWSSLFGQIRSLGTANPWLYEDEKPLQRFGFQGTCLAHPTAVHWRPNGLMNINEKTVVASGYALCQSKRPR